jgi:hypothetical protein
VATPAIHACRLAFYFEFRCGYQGIEFPGWSRVTSGRVTISSVSLKKCCFIILKCLDFGVRVLRYGGIADSVNALTLLLCIQFI